MKKFFCTVLTVFIMISLCSCSQNTSEDEASDVVATVNGEDITKEEYEYFRKKYKSQVLNDCLEKFSVEYTEDFWTTEFDGVTPGEILHEKVIKECALAKIQLSLMKEEGIYEEITFEALKTKAEAFNKENENKEGVVGIKSIQMSQFYSYYLQTGIMELQNILAEGKLNPNEEEIEKKISEMANELSSESRENFESIAKSRLKTEKYEKYINELYENAEIKEF